MSLLAARVGATVARGDGDHVPCLRCGVTRKISRSKRRLRATGYCTDCLPYARADARARGERL